MGSLRSRLRSERGLALPMALGMMLVLSLSLVTAIVYGRSSEQSATQEKRGQSTYSAAEAALATAVSVLATVPDPRLSSALPGCASPTPVSVDAATGDYCGSLSGLDWTITARGFAANAVSGGGQHTRSITQVASIVHVGAGGLGELWNRLYQYDTSRCVEFKKIIITVPIVTGSCVKLKGNPERPSQLLGSYVSIGGYVELDGSSDSIGLSGTPIRRADIAGTCNLRDGSGPHRPCGPADAVYASTVTASPTDLARPTVDFPYWYANAKPGPRFPCTVGALPIGSEFDRDTSYDNDAQKMDLTPKGETYTCQYWQAGELVGELAWNHVTHVLKVKGTIFFDGGVEAKDRNLTNYQGRGTIYTSDKVDIEEAFCAGGDGTRDCKSAMTNWDATKNTLILVTGGLKNVNEEAFTMDSDEAAFQGAVWSQGKCKVGKKASVSAPLICGQLGIKEDDSIDDPTISPWPAALIGAWNGQVYGNPTSDFQILLRPQLG
ncbi:MAG: hypothetical protein ABR583_04825 [Gaiellaceae bacterium]